MSAPSRGRGRGRGKAQGSPGVVRSAPGVSVTANDSSGNKPRSARTDSENQKAGSDQKTPPRGAVSDSSVNSSPYKQLNVSASSFIPRSAQSQPYVAAIQTNQDMATRLSDLSLNLSATVMIENIERILAVLLNNPSQFDRLAPELSKYLSETITTENQLFSSADVVFEWGLMQDNFSYTCSRACLYIRTHVNLNFNGTFWQHLFKRCRLEHEERAAVIERDPTRLRRFAVFISELFIRSDPKLAPLMKAIFDLLELMLSQIDNLFAKCVTQVLKMVGACLEDELQSTEKNVRRMDDIISSIQSICTKPTAHSISHSASNMLMSVVTLRRSKWGRSISPSSSNPRSPAASSEPQEYLLEPVFYSRTGQQITRAQAGFGDVNAEYQRFSSESPLEHGDARRSNGAPVSSTTSDSSLYEPHDFIDSAEEDIDADDELDIYVVDDDEQMTEEMWEDFRKFEQERLQENS